MCCGNMNRLVNVIIIRIEVVNIENFMGLLVVLIFKVIVVLL